MAELSPDAFGFSAATGPKELDPSAFGFGPGRAVAQPEKPAGGLVAAAKQAIGSTIKGAGQAASDFIPGVTTANPVTAYGQGIIDANPTTVQSLGDIVESPWMATKEAIGNAAGSMAGMVGSALGAKAVGGGLSAVAPFTGPAAPIVGGVGKLVSTFGPGVAPIVTAALPSYGGIREEQIKADPANEADARSKAIAALGAGTVGAIETKFGPQDWALSAMKKGGIEAVAKNFADAKSIPGAIGKGILHGGAVEGAEELVQNPIEQLASYQDPTSRQAVGETLFGGAMGALGGGALGGGMAGVAKAMTPEQPVVTLPGASPTVAQTSTAPTTAVQPNVAPQPATVSAPIEINPAAGPLQAATVAGIQSGAVQPAVTTNQVTNEANQVDAGSAVTVAQATGQGEAPVQEASVPAASGLSGYARAPEVGAATFDRSTTPKNGGYGATENYAQPVVAEPANTGAPRVTPIGLAGSASAGQATTNTPAAPEIPPVSTAAPTTQTKQAETAGVPTSLTGEIQSNANQTEEAVTPASGREAQPAAVSGSARIDWEKDAEALATKAARLREMAARAVGQNRIRLTDLAGRMEAAREAIVGQAGATNKDSLTVEGKAPAVTSQSPPGKSEDEPVRGAVGMKLSAGQVVTTLTGRTTTPFPKFQSSTGKMTQAHLNAVDRWLLSNAAEEAESRGDDFNALPFRRALESKTIPQADKDSAEMYLFEWQPDVIKPITRPLVPESKSPPVVTNETATDAPQTPLSSAGETQTPRKNPGTKSNPPPIMRRDDLVGAIMRVTGGNGIASVMAQDIAGDKAGSALAKLRGLFTNRGVSDLGDVAMLLREEEGFDVRDGNHLAELIRRASSGDVAVNMERAARDADADQEKRHRDRIRSQAKKYGVKTQFVKFSDLEARVLKVMEQRHDKAVAALDDRAKKRFDAELERSYSLVSEDEVDAVLVDVNGRGFRGRSFWNEATKLLRGMNDDAVARKMEEVIDAAVEGPEPDWLKDDDGRGNQPTGGGDEADRGDQAEAPGFGLAGQSAEDVARQEADRVAAEKAAKEEAEKEAAEKAAAEKKSIADKIKERAENPDNFQFGEDAKAAAKPMGGLFDQPENHQKSESASEPPMKKGDRFTDGAGNVWEVWMARTGLIEAHPVVNGKPVVNRDSGVRFATTSNARLANPEARTDFTPMAKEKNPVTPQLMVGDPERYIKVAADSIGKLRKDDVYRVLIESNQPAFRADIARYIKKNRPDLAAEVDSVLAEESASSAEQKSRTDREPSAEPSAQSVIRATIGGQPEAVPPAVLSRIKIALNRLREVERELTGVERARGRGHILALEVRDQQSAIKGAQAKLAEFRKMAPGNNIDAEAVIASMGGEPDFSRFGKPAEEVIADSQDYEEGDEIAFTPHAVSNLAPSVSGILTAKQSAGNGRFRLTIRTDKKAPQGGGNVTVTVYSQNGKVDRIGDGLNKPQKPAEPEQRSVINQAFEEGQKKVVESESASQPGDFNAMFNDIMGEISPEESVPATPKPSADRAPSEEPSAPRAPRTPRASRPTRTAGEAAASAASNLAGGFGDITNALGALFGTKSGGRLSTGLSFDEDTYAKALPLFKSAVSKFNAAGKDLRELMKALMLDVQRKFGSDALRNMQPYVVRFMEDVQAGKISLEEQNVTDKRGRVDLERDSQNPNAENGLGEKGVLDGSEPNGRSGEPGVSGAEANGGAGSGGGISGHEALATGAASDNAIYTGASELSPGSAGNSVSVGSGDLRLDGPPIEPEAAKGIDAAATSRSDLARKVALQSRAPTSPDASIADALPILSEGQQDDVAKAEKRFAAPDGYGMLFTNGTGTGKTFTGLGIVKRHVNAGKGNILIVVPNDKIIEDWQKSGQLLGLTISALANTKDAGKGVVITTYANMGQNSELAKRDWDLVVHDEAHHLMENAKTEVTNSLKTLRAITLHPDGAYQRHAMLNGEGMARLAELDALAKSERMSDDERNWLLASATQAKADKLRAELRDKESAIKADVAARQGADRPRALFLSFTPFAYEPSIDWANGYLFDYNEGRPSEEGVFRGYNEGSNREQFFMQHFGYRMRTGKLNKPDAKVDAGLMQRQFNGFLKKKGSLSGRMLDVDADYDRRFVLVDSAIGARIDEALEWFENKEDETNDKTRTAAMRDVRKIISEKFDYLSRRYLLEAIKAQEVIPHIREHLAMGRKVVVFHDYNKGGGFNPFDLSERAIDAEMSESGDAEAINGIIREFRTEFKDLISSDLFKASSPITNFQIEFPGILLVNGSVPAKVRRENVAKFQDDASGPQVILVQAQAGKEGISLHDTTGKHQRVLFNLGQPTQPTMAMQQEGRIYRMGQVSDAIIRYLNTGTNWEKWAFATTIAQRASAAENLGSGEMARAIKDAFISGFEESGDYRAGMEGEGKGGKDRDKAANDAISEYDRAKAFYFGTQKKDARSKSREGTDYYATPEPIGLKMVEFADIRPGDDVMEPSAGHGAIARWFSEQSKRTAIEPSSVLRARLAMVFDGNIIGRDFESLNVVNKFDAIVMNPPFGVGGKTAIDHLTKAATHLRNGGRIVAILPTGPAADKKLDKWLNEGEEKPIKPLVVHPTLGPIYFGDTISTRSDFNAVVERALSNDTIVAKEPSMPSGTAHLVRSIVKIDPTGNRSRTEGANKGLYLIADMQLPSVTFERASTAVRAHIVVLEKQTDQAKLNTVPQQINRDYTDAADIGELFTRMENAFVRPRENARKEEDSTQNPVSEAKGPAGKVQPVGAEATVEKVLPGGKLLTDAPVVTYTTKAGKKLEGVIAKGLQKDGAKAIDPFTWAKDGGFFIRLKHVVRPKEESGGDDAIRYNVASPGAGRGPIFSFAGQQSATADKFQLDRAQQLLADGADAEAVRQQTGWFKGADEKWRYEIDDSGASLKAHGFGFGELLDAIGKNPKLADVLDHPALFAAYPSIAGASVEAFDEKSQNNGELVANKGGGFTIRVNAGLGEAKALSVLLHEIQHGIQNVEGFASGGSPDTMASFDNPQIRTLEDKISALMASSKPGKQVAKEVAEINAKIADLRRENPYSAYRRLAGEVEARNVQARRNFSADRRKYANPDETADTARADVIVVFNGKAAASAPAPANARPSAAGVTGVSPADSAIYSMAQEGKSAAEILSFIGKASRRPFNRYLANALRNLGAASTITLDSQGGFAFGNRSYAQKYAAAYNPKTDTVALFTPREAERHVLHELVHGATLKAIANGGPASMRMRALFRHVQKSGALDGQYGMSSLDEFVAEAFSNPKFQQALKAVQAPKGSTLKSAWQWFVQAVARILGLRTPAMETALDRAMTEGAALMRENAELAGVAQGSDRYAIAWHGTPHVWAPEPGFPHGRPRLDKMGSGEGAQAYGWGWYSAESRGVADEYAGKLSKPIVSFPTGVDSAHTGGLSGAAKEVVKRMQQIAEETKYGSKAEQAGKAFFMAPESVQKELSGNAPRWNAFDILDAGNLYQLDIPDDVLPRLLDWDKPLSEQSPAVQEALRGSAIAPDESTWQHWTGQQLYEGEVRARTEFDGQAKGDARKLTSEQLASIGIPGLRYLDQGSRADGTGTYNYVIWDQKVLDRIALLERNGEKLDAIRAADEAVRFNVADDLPPTITINGVERPTTNSNGKPIHPTAEGLRNFWKWFGDSKIVDEQGRPLVVYHSTLDGRLTEFGRTGKFMGHAGVSGISVTDNPSAASRYLDRYAEYGWVDGRPNQPFDKHVLPLYAKANNPLYRNEPIQTRIKMGFPLPNGYVNPLISDGYDALIRDDAISRSGPVKHSSAKNAIKGQEIIVFSPEQLKSATGNRGTFDATDPDIRYNLAADWQTAPSRAATTIRQYVADSMRSDSNTSWLTPFNTQYHKAEKWAAEGKVRFKRVFDLVQRFLGDVSKFAVMAQNEAPTLFHEWRTLADVKRTLTSGDVLGNQHRADVAAIASPLYEGTLYGGGNPLSGIRWSDDQLRDRFNLTARQIKLYHEALAAVKVSMDEMAKSIVAQHAKRVGVDFDEGMSLEDMVADVSNRMEELQDEIRFQFLSEEAEESVAASVEHYLEMDMEEEAQKTRANFEKQNKAAQAQIEQIDKTMEDIKAVESKNVALQKAGYFPLMRFGKHTVTAKDADGKVQFFGMYEGIPLVPRSGQYEANKVAAELRAEFPEWTVTTGIKNDEKYKLYQGLNIEAIQLFADHMDKEDLEPFQEFIRLATNNRSAQRRLLHRQGTPGFDRDVRRTLAQFVVSNARATSSNYHTQDMLRAAADAEKDGGDIGAEAVKLVEYVRNPAEEAQALRGFLFFNFLGGSLASAAVNLTQTPMMTLPFLSKFESVQRVTRRLMAAAKMAAGNPESLPAGKLRDALLRAEMDGVTAPQEIHQLTATAANNIFAGSRLANWLLRGWGAPFAMAESFNRRIAFIAAFQIAESMSPAELANTGFKDAFEFAEDAVKQTQGIYNKGNRMNVGRGSVGSVLMTFKQYSIMYLELLKRLPPKQRAIMVGVLLLAAGGGGLPGVEDVEDLIDTIGQWLGFATNSRRALRNTLTEWVGRDGSDIVLNGLLSRMGIDLHSRMGMQNLIPGSGILKQSSVDKGRDIEEFFGPAASVVKSLGDALESLATGHPGRAGMALAPGAVRNVVQGAKMAATGYAEDAKGRRTVPVNELESAAKMVGFNPKSVADYGTVKRDIAQDQRLVGVKREEFTSAIADAILSGDTEARKQAMSDMAQWNRDNPTLRFTIAPGAIVRRVKEARTEGATRFLKAVPKGMRSQAIEEMRQ